MTGNVGCVLTEKYSAAATLRREKLRIISGITALNLFREQRFAEAEEYRRPFIEIKDYSVEDFAQGLGFGFIPNKNEIKEVATELISIAKAISQDPKSLKDDEIKKYSERLVELLNVISSIARI